MAEKSNKTLGGAGLLVEFFLADDGVYYQAFPRPHDTGMVTLEPQNFNIRIAFTHFKFAYFRITLEKREIVPFY
jgi:formate-dependent phosphoribosylglycinamide formyltransferase (GAR transformylase)